MENKKSFIGHFAIIGSGVFINLILSVATTLILTRVVDPNEYGQFSLFVMYESIAIMVLCLGMDQALARYYYEIDSVEYRKELYNKCIRIPIISSAIVSFVTFALSYFQIIELEFPTFIIFFLCVYTISELIYRFDQLVIRLSYESKLYSRLNVLQKMTYSTLAIILVLTTGINGFAVLSFSMCTSFFVCMILSAIKMKRILNCVASRYEGNSISYAELLRYAYPYVFSMGITTLFQSLDRISLSHFRTYSEVGVYSAATALVRVFSVIQISFSTLWAPMAIEHYSQDKKDQLFYQNGNRIITVIMFGVGLSLILFKDILAFVLGEKYREAASILPFLVYNPIMYTVSETTVTGLVFTKKSQYHVVIALGACISNAIGNYWLVPIFGCKGAALSTGVSYIVFFTLRTIMSNHFFYVDYELKKFAILTAFSLAYAFYNTFMKGIIISILGYFICVILLVFLYKDTIIMMIHYLKNTIRHKEPRLHLK